MHSMTVSIRRAALVAFSFLLSLATAQFAVSAEYRYISENDAISEGTETTYFDLALQFAPGLANTPSDGRALSAIRHLGGDELPATIASPSIGGIDRIDIRQAGKPRMLVLFDFGQADDAAEGINVLALYDVTGAPRLLDAMNVGLDRENSFLEPGYVVLSPTFGMALVRNSHHNAGEEYLQSSLIGIWDDKLHDVDTVFSMSWLTAEEDLTVRPSFAAVKGELALDATFTITRKHCESACVLDADYPSMTERVKARYNWDAAAGKFARPEKAYDRIPLPDMEE
jgi:hypothetical protein